MALRLSRATGNWLTAGTWETIDATSYVNSETATGVVTTSYLASAGATTGVITATGIGLKLSVRTGTTGTLTAHLAIAGVEVPNTAVTINTADLPVAATADLNGGWFFLKFAAGVVLAGATSYTVEVKTSSSSQISLFSTSGTAWSHFISTNDATAPIAGDDVIIAGELTGAGTSNSFTVTYDGLASSIVDYGAASTSLVLPSLAICNKGTLSYGATAATNYYLRQSGNIIVYSGGIFNIGTTGTPIPRDSSAILNFDCGANVDFGLTVRNLGTWNSQGLSRTSGKNIYYCKLNTDEATNSTSLGVDTDTGWLDNDVIAVASTTRTASQCEGGTLNGNANAADMTVDGFAGAGGGLAAAHSGTSPIQAEVVLLTRNVQIFGASATLQSYIDIKATATIDCDWTEFKWLGSSTFEKRGIDTACTTGVQSWQYCSRHTSTVASSMGWNMSGATGTGLTISNNVTFNVANSHFINAATSGTWTVDSNIFIRSTDSTSGISLADIGGTFTNNTMVGMGAVSQVGGIRLTENFVTIGTFSGNTIHSCPNFGLWITGALSGTISTLKSWRNGSNGVYFGSSNDSSISANNVIFNTLDVWGNTTSNIRLQSSYKLTFNNLTSNGDSSFSTASGLDLTNSATTAQHTDIKINSGNFSTVSGILTAHTQDINVVVSSLYVQITMTNTKLGAATEVANFPANVWNGSYIKSEKHDQVAGAHKSLFKYGTIDLEATIVHTGSQSMRMLPNNASNKLESASFFAAVANGATVTPSVYVREAAAYNGNRCRLIVKRNDAIGITADTVLDTRTGASDAVFELMTGTTIAATDDGVMEFVVDCDGTAGTGYVYVDSFSVV